jgi:hypothetical protein
VTQFRWWHEANLWNALGAALKARRRELCFCGSHHRKPTQAKAVLPNGVCCVQRNYPNGKSQLANVLPVPSDPLRATRPGTTHEETARTHECVDYFPRSTIFHRPISADHLRVTLAIDQCRAQRLRPPTRNAHGERPAARSGSPETPELESNTLLCLSSFFYWKLPKETSTRLNADDEELIVRTI